ncbi:ATP-binding cassette domain-containing protein, partial [Bullifex porci]
MNILSIENISKTVNDEPLFENVTLGVEEGEKIGIVGKNGEGKSTFLKVIMGILP